MTFISCNKKNKLKGIFISSKDYYWQYNDECHPNGGLGSINFKFDDKGLSHQYSLGATKGYALVEGESLAAETWSIKNDSILTWGNRDYTINHIDKRLIVLVYKDSNNKDKNCVIRLLKVVDDK